MGLLSKLFDAAIKPKVNRDDFLYGPLSMPPSAEAGAIVTAMNAEERYNFNEILRLLQEGLETTAGVGRLGIHPDARASLWGTALSKMSDHYHEIGGYDKVYIS